MASNRIGRINEEIQRELAEHRGWATEEELMDFLKPKEQHV